MISLDELARSLWATSRLVAWVAGVIDSIVKLVGTIARISRMIDLDRITTKGLSVRVSALKHPRIWKSVIVHEAFVIDR